MAFADGLNATVAIEHDAQPRDAHGVKQQWVAVSGLDAVPCRIVEQSSLDTEMAQRPNVKASGKVLFGRPVALAAPLDRLIYMDPDLGRRVLMVRGQSRNAHQMNHHWIVEFDEFKG